MLNKIFFVVICLLVISNISIQTVSAETISWGASSGAVDGYKVYYSHYNGASCEPINKDNYIDVGNVNSCSTEILPLDSNVVYCITVTAYNTLGESEPAEALRFTKCDEPIPPPTSGVHVSN